jgi:ABC-type amino acid transport substrate-binding protein
MSRFPRIASMLALLLLTVLLGLAAGCGGDAAETDAADLESTVEPPVIAEEGILRAGVDKGYPPFASEEDGEVVGLDVDAASALSEQLGLRLEIVDVPVSEIATALAEGDVDVALGALPLDQALLAEASFAGSYLVDGPAFYSSTETTETLSDLRGVSVAVQEASVARWRLVETYGEDAVATYPTLREAFAAVADGEESVVAGDAVVGAYIGRDYPSVRFVSQFGSGVPLGVAVAPGADELEEAVRTALDELAAEGVLETIRAKWVGDLPELETASIDG